MIPGLTPEEERRGARMFDRLRLEAQQLGFTDVLILKSALSGKIMYAELPDKLRAALARLGAPPSSRG